MKRLREERPGGEEICKSFFRKEKVYPNPSAIDWLEYANFLMTDQPEYRWDVWRHAASRRYQNDFDKFER